MPFSLCLHYIVHLGAVFLWFEATADKVCLRGSLFFSYSETKLFHSYTMLEFTI